MDEEIDAIESEDDGMSSGADDGAGVGFVVTPKKNNKRYTKNLLLQTCACKPFWFENTTSLQRRP